VSSDLKAILGLEVPLIVLLGERHMKLREITSLIPGAIIELPKLADEELEVLVNNKPVGTGLPVKVGENFGVKISYIGDLRERIRALGALAEQA
jgi:flagellar motor switch protein FliN/FliY